MSKGFWALGILSGCLITQLMSGSFAIGQAQAVGVEKMVRAAPGVTQVVMDAPGELVIKPGNDEKVVIEAEPKVLAKLEAVISGDTLTLKTKGNIRTDKGIFYTVTLRKFRSVKTLSSGNVAIAGFGGNDIDVLASGSGDIALSGIKPTRLSLKIVDAGNITASGEGAQFSARIEGSGNIDAIKFVARRAEASIDGAGNISLRAEETLKASIDGVGNIEYAGKARVSKQINGAGNIERAD
jgi:hypothetical protein